MSRNEPKVKDNGPKQKRSEILKKECQLSIKTETEQCHHTTTGHWTL